MAYLTDRDSSGSGYQLMSYSSSGEYVCGDASVKMRGKVWIIFSEGCLFRH